MVADDDEMRVWNDEGRDKGEDCKEGDTGDGPAVDELAFDGDKDKGDEEMWELCLDVAGDGGENGSDCDRENDCDDFGDLAGERELNSLS